MPGVTTTVERLSAHTVKLHVAVPAAEFEKAIDAAFAKLAREVKIPGFRPGKAPRRLLEARFGVDLARERALRDALPGYYSDAVEREAIDVIAAPSIDITAGADSGDVEFDAVVEVRPVVTVAGYDGLEVVVEGASVPDDLVDGQIDGLRERFADLQESVNPLIDGNVAEIDVKAYVHDEVIDDFSATDYLYEVGSGRIVPQLDVELRGKRPGAILKFVDQLPEAAGDRAGQEVAFQVLVKDAKRKVLPPLSDEWVSEVTEFDTVESFRADVRTRLELQARVGAQLQVRDKVLDQLAALVEVEIPEALVGQEMERRLHDLVHQLEHRGITLVQYLAATGQQQDAFLAVLRDTATRAVRSDLALRAVMSQEAMTVDDEELAAEIERIAAQLQRPAADVRRDLDQRGALQAVRFDLARSKALRWLVERAVVVDESGRPVDLTLPVGAPHDGEPGSSPDTHPDTHPETEEPQA